VNRIVRWISAEGEGAEYLSIRGTAEGIAAEGLVVGARHGLPYGLRYRIACDARWRVREAVLSLAGEDRRLHLLADGEGNWRDGDGHPVAALQGCVDVDISATPFTNTLPIRRLGLQPGEAREVAVAYVAVPALTPEPVRQRYTCLGAGRYRYEGLFQGYMGELPVDADGLVLDYPGAFRRV
jgi:uncharacterized protein